MKLTNLIPHYLHPGHSNILICNPRMSACKHALDEHPEYARVRDCVCVRVCVPVTHTHAPTHTPGEGGVRVHIWCVHILVKSRASGDQPGVFRSSEAPPSFNLDLLLPPPPNNQETKSRKWQEVAGSTGGDILFCRISLGFSSLIG